MRVFRRMAACALASATAIALLPLGASPAGAVSAPEVIAQGLNNPYKLNFGPDGALYVAEAGSGGDTCFEEEGPEGDVVEFCLGDTGSVTRIGAAQERVITGLPSLAINDEEWIGPVDVAFGADGASYVVTGLGANPAERAMIEGAEGLATVLRVPAGGGDPTVFADIGAFESANNPDESYNPEPDSNPFGIEAVSDGFLVNDAGGNALYHVTTGGQISLRTLFPVEQAEFPPRSGQMVPMQPVPTAVETDPDGGIHVSQLTGFPFQPFEADVFDIDATGDITGSTGGFTNIIDIAYAADGTLYVLEFSSVGLLNAPPLRSQLVQVRTDGTRKVLLNDSDMLGAPPGGVTVGPDGMVYVSLCNAFCGPGAGSVIKVDPTVARDAATADACPPAEVPGTEFIDIALSVHRESVECLKWWGVVGGVTDALFAPGATITRGQAASLTGNVLEAAGVELSASPPNAFADDDESVHHLRINQLAELGLVTGFADGTFRASEPVTRAQIVTLLVGAYEAITGSAPTAGGNAFTDDDASVHHDNINAAAAAGWVAGRTASTFEPGGTAERGQVASFYARLLSTLVADGEATLPA